MMQNANGMMYTNPTAIKNLMKNYDKDEDYISPITGLAGMDATDIPISQRHVIIDVPEESRQEMFDNAKREFLQENFYDAAKAAAPTWKPGKAIKAGALDGITREQIDKSLTVTMGQYGETFKRGFDLKL